MKITQAEIQEFLELVEEGHRELYWLLMQYEYETYTGKPRKKPWARPKNWETKPVRFIAYKLETNDSSQPNNSGRWLGPWADGLVLLWFRPAFDTRWEDDDITDQAWLPLMYFEDRPAWDAFTAELNRQQKEAEAVYAEKIKVESEARELSEYRRLKRKYEK